MDPIELPNEIAALIPPSRDDEPKSLRQDIIDELADHLACAYQREVLRGLDSKRARNRVLDQFGDPAAVARRLWLDAMKGKIMAQRVLIMACLMLTVASLALAGTVWRQASIAQQQSARAASVIEALSAQNEQSQRTQRDMLEQVRAMSEIVRSTHSLEWNPITFKITEGTADGPPAVGVSVSLSERVANGGQGGGMWQSKPSVRQTDQAGIVDFGVVRPGGYNFQVRKTWDQGTLTTGGNIDIEPGSKIQKHISCPKTPFARVPVRFRWSWPADLEKEKLIIRATFAHAPIKMADASWTLSAVDTGAVGNRFNQASALPLSYAIRCGPDMPTASLLPLNEPLFWTLNKASSPLMADFAVGDLKTDASSTGSITWEEGDYRLTSLYLMRPRPIAGADASDIRRYELIAKNDAFGMVGQQDTYKLLPSAPSAAARPADAQKKTGRRRGNLGMNNIQVDYPFQNLPGRDVFLWQAFANDTTVFHVVPGQPNEYTIPLPEEVITTAREGLKDEEKGKQIE
jgi:hypothetical protein